MPCVSVTRLRLRSIRFLPRFAVSTLRSLRQVRRAPGFQRGAVLLDRSLTFWTLTEWDGMDAMRHYMVSGSHKAAMPRLMHWCDEACAAHWEEPGGMPSWQEVIRRLRGGGRTSKVLHPSAQHASMHFREPRTTFSRPVRPVRQSLQQSLGAAVSND